MSTIHGTSRRGMEHLWWSVHMHGAMRDVLGIWACRKGGQRCGGAGHVSGWGQTCVWVGPVAWGIVEGHCWGSSMLLWGFGYVVQPGDMVGCMECGMESAKAAVQRVAGCDRQVGGGDGHGVMDEQALACVG